MYQGTTLTEEPSAVGPAGQAWRVRLMSPEQRPKLDHAATLGIFIVRVPGAHIAWDHWAVSMIHLREIDSVKPAFKKFPAATHEFMIASINPEEPLPGLDVIPGWHVPFLTPIDVCEQIEVPNDSAAYDVLELAVRIIVSGVASPDQDWRAWWKQAIKEAAKSASEAQVRVQ